MCRHDEKGIILEGTRRGLYCSNCGKWIKWVGKDEYNKLVLQGLKVIDRRIKE